MDKQTCKWDNARKQHHQACASVLMKYTVSMQACCSKHPRNVWWSPRATIAKLTDSWRSNDSAECIVIWLSPNRLEISSSMFLSMNFVDFFLEQEKPVRQFQLTKTVVLDNTTDLEGKSRSCSAYIRYKLYCGTMGTSNKNRRWRLTTTEPPC